MSIVVFIFAGLLAGIGIGLVGISAASIITPMLVALLGFNAYQAIGIALAADVFASLISSIIYFKNKNIDIKNGILIMIVTMIATYIASYFAKFIPNDILGGVSMYMTILLGIKLIIKPITTPKDSKIKNLSKNKKLALSIILGLVIGTICGTIGTGGGVMLLLALTGFLGYSLKMAVGTSVFIMAFTALTGATAHIIHGGTNVLALIICVIFAVLGSRTASRFANKTDNKNLNKVSGVFLILFGVILLVLKHIVH
ncbi:sulfite exporter TauE/SafE family protein [Clostridium sp. Ade.TY]|uniref:TSUP family transporter n=1 Tax=Clostridium sp. Ade.TY TaxID=1391647 RepID=UPI000424EAD8